jgi:hypothetical protein
MRLWEYLFQEDQRLDLDNLENAEKWLFSRSWWPKDKAKRPDPGLWSDQAKVTWKLNISCLRNLAQRLEDRPRTQGKIEEFQADVEAERTLNYYLGMLRLVWQPATKPSPKRRSRRPATHRGRHPQPRPSGKMFHAALFPTLSNGTLATLRLNSYFPFDGLRVFWQSVFQSFVDRDSPAICMWCGVNLGDKTPTGRPKKKRECDKCRHQVWWAALPPERKREKHRRDQRKKDNKNSRIKGN